MTGGAHLAQLAREPRPAGSAAEAAAREYCAAELRLAGFEVHEEAFEFSAWPGRYATSAAGVLSILLLAAAAHMGYRGDPVAALGILAGGAVLLALASLYLMRSGILNFPFARQRSLNLVARRGAPTLWLVAHLDSKSQPVSIMVRALGITATLLVWAGAFFTAFAQLQGEEVSAMWLPVAMVGVLAGIPVAASIVRARSNGAVDNASGMATVLLAAAGAPRALPLGVLITSAEELGLAGARAFVGTHPPGRAINVDGVDDRGRVRLTYTRRAPARLIDLLTRAAADSGEAVAKNRLFPGVLLDGVALADGGWEVVTLSRGDARTVARIHTSRDDLARLSGTGADLAGRLLARAVALDAAAETRAS
jgi:hypothetical protein